MAPQFQICHYTTGADRVSRGRDRVMARPYGLSINWLLSIEYGWACE